MSAKAVVTLEQKDVLDFDFDFDFENDINELVAQLPPAATAICKVCVVTGRKFNTIN